MKLIRIISLFTTILFFSINLYSRDINSSEKSRLSIYNFSTTDSYENVKKNEKNYQYYSIVIPETITKTLAKSGNYQVHREKDSLTIETEFKDKKDKKQYLAKLKDLGLQSKSDYIITGNFNVVDNELSIRIVIFDAVGREIEVIEYESDELGVQMQETTDKISELISDNIDKLNRTNRDKLKKSPFISLYRPFSIITIGVDSGYFYFLGDWRFLYNDSLYISPFIDFDITENVALSFKFTSIQSDSEDKKNNAYTQIRILSSSMSLCYLYSFNRYFGIAGSAGGGLTKTTITIEPGKGIFTTSQSERISIDPNADASLFAAFNSSSLTLRAGVNYKRIFYKGTPMNTGTIFAGAGIHF